MFENQDLQMCKSILDFYSLQVVGRGSEIQLEVGELKSDNLAVNVLMSEGGSFCSVVARKSEILVSNLGSDVCFSSKLCIYTVLQSVQWVVVCSAFYATMHYKEPFKSFDKSRA